MFSKSDVEILCDTIVTLTDKYERFIEKTDGRFPAPHIGAIDAIVIVLEERFLPGKRSTLSVRDIALNAEQLMSHPPRRPEMPKRSHHAKPKPPITVLHGAPENPTMPSPPINRAGFVTEEVKDGPGNTTTSANLKPANPAKFPSHSPTPPAVSNMPSFVDKEINAANIDKVGEALLDQFDDGIENNLPQKKNKIAA